MVTLRVQISEKELVHMLKRSLCGLCIVSVKAVSLQHTSKIPWKYLTSRNYNNFLSSTQIKTRQNSVQMKSGENVARKMNSISLETKMTLLVR